LREAVAEILSFLTQHFGEDFKSYSSSLAEKRIIERAGQLRMAHVADYLRFLRADQAEPGFLARMLRIRFSCFFRDPLQFELLGSIIIPTMLTSSPRGLFRVWCAACASGEEACSLAIIIDEARQMLESQTHVQIFATDIAEDALEEARTGRYLPGSLAGVTLQRINNFTCKKTSYQVNDKILNMITYSCHDLLDTHTYAPPESLFGGFDLISCRNFLMYLDPEAYSRVLDNLFRALNPEGVLLLGKAESVPERYAPYLERIVDFGNLYRKRSVPRR